jgi:hypothetical protein
MKALPVLDSKAAATDVGSEKLHVSIAGDSPKVFGTFTSDLEALREWFKDRQVRTVGVEKDSKPMKPRCWLPNHTSCANPLRNKDLRSSPQPITEPGFMGRLPKLPPMPRVHAQPSTLNRLQQLLNPVSHVRQRPF